MLLDAFVDGNGEDWFVKEWTDAELLERVLSRDPRGWPEMLSRFEKLIWYVLTKFGRTFSEDDREEIYHNVIIELLRDDMHVLRVYDPSRAKLSHYITLHTQWKIGKFRRDAKRLHPLGEEDDAANDASEHVADSVVDQIVSRNAIEHIDRFVGTMKAKDRQFFDLHYRQGIEARKIAKIMGVSFQAVYLRKYKLEARLAEAFSSEKPAEPIPRQRPVPDKAPDPIEAEPTLGEQASGVWQPREYELRAVRDLRVRLPRHRRVLAVGPTGCGKTVIAAMLIESDERWRVLFVVHRYELADQAHRALTQIGIRCGIIMAQEESMHGSARSDPDARVQVASVQTLSRREIQQNIDVLIIDEAHRVMADSYQKIATAHPEAMVLGLTATPERDDAKGLGDFFRDMYEIAKPSTLQQQRHLASPRWFGARADVIATLTERLRGARTSNGDFAPRDLARAVDSKMLLGEVVSEAIRIAPNVSKVVFAGSVNHSKELARKFNQAGIVAAHLDGMTPDKERETIIGDLANGRLEVICNYDVLSEGWDLPDLGCVVLARPFRSRKKYLQVVGRGMRWREGARPIVLDHGNNAPRFGVWPGDDIEWSLEEVKRTKGDPPWKQCQGCLEKIPLAATVCPECGHECPIERTRKEREETEAKLEEMTRAEYEALRGRVEAMAANKGASPAWVESVMESAR